MRKSPENGATRCGCKVSQSWLKKSHQLPIIDAEQRGAMMKKLNPFVLLRFLVFVACTTLHCAANGQQMYTDLEARVSGLPSLMAKSHDLADVLPTSLDTILHDRSICCGRDSALEDSVVKADPLSLKDVASKLEGRHLLGDGRPISVKAEFWPIEAVDGLRIVNTLNDKHALLMSWNAHLFVVYGVVYRWVDYSADSGPYCVLRRLLLLDTRFSDSRRAVEYNRETDDPAKVQGFLLVTYAAQ